VGFLDRLVAGAEHRSAATSGLARPANWLFNAFGGTRSASGQHVTVATAMGVAPVWSAVSIIAGQVGQLPFKVFRDLGSGNVVEQSDHRAYRMLHTQPNPITPADRFWSTVTAHLLLWGNAYIEKVRSPDSGLVEELWLIEPSTVVVKWDAANRTKYFEETRAYGGDMRTLTADEVLHVTGLSLNGLIGESVISRCRNMLGTAMAREQFEGGFYERGAVVRGVIQHPGQLKTEGLKNLRESFSAIYGGAANAHQTAVLEEGATYQTLSMPMSDLEFVAAQQLSRTDIAIMFKLPPAYLGGSSGDPLTYATVEGYQIQFAQHTIAPLVNTIAKAVGSDLGIFPFQSWYPEFVLEALMRGDHASRASFYAAMHNIEAITVNEIRARENMPPVPWGDERPVPPRLPTPQSITAAEGDPNIQDSPTNGNGASSNGNGPVAVPAQVRSMTPEVAEMRSLILAREHQRDRDFEELRTLAEAMRPHAPTVTFEEGAFQVTTPPSPVTIEDGAIRVEAPPPANVTVEPPDVRFEEGSIRVDAPVTVEAPPPSEVRFEEGAIRVDAPPPANVTVEAAPTPNVTVDVHRGGRRTVEFSDGRKATIEEEE
jgi:HK97 family phage portal protein